MILSASRRTDIPAFYPQWLMNRLRAGEVLVPAVRNPRQYRRIVLSPEVIDCIVFWTKNPMPLMPALPVIQDMGYPFYIQFTLTGYGKDIEPSLPDKAELAGALIELGKTFGPQAVVWRYDPILIDEYHTAVWHIQKFQDLCGRLAGYTDRCVISFIDLYAKLKGRFRALTQPEITMLAAAFSDAAAACGLPLYTCAEEVDLSSFGIRHGACIDPDLAQWAAGVPLRLRKEPGRAVCHCAQSVDIGVYNTCGHGCAYCYANQDGRRAAAYARQLDPAAPSIAGWPGEADVIVEKPMATCRRAQKSIFDPDEG